jgi:hypothetical protein
MAQIQSDRSDKQPTRRSLRSILEPAAIGVMALGGLMMFQPFVLALYSYSFLVILIGVFGFIIVSHFPE